MPNKLRDCANRHQWDFNKCLRNIVGTFDDLCCISYLCFKSECYTVTSRSLDDYVKNKIGNKVLKTNIQHNRCKIKQINLIVFFLHRDSFTKHFVRTKIKFV